jgi:acyl carrier protein
LNEDVLREVICGQFLGGDMSFPLGIETDLLAEGICDSLALVQIAVELENRVPGLSIQDRDVTRENFCSIAAILNYLETKGS